MLASAGERAFSAVLTGGALSYLQESVKKTHKVIIVEECMRSGGIGASVSSWCGIRNHDVVAATHAAASGALHG